MEDIKEDSKSHKQNVNEVISTIEQLKIKTDDLEEKDLLSRIFSKGGFKAFLQDLLDKSPTSYFEEEYINKG